MALHFVVIFVNSYLGFLLKFKRHKSAGWMSFIIFYPSTSWHGTQMGTTDLCKPNTWDVGYCVHDQYLPLSHLRNEDALCEYSSGNGDILKPVSRDINAQRRLIFISSFILGIRLKLFSFKHSHLPEWKN